MPKTRFLFRAGFKSPPLMVGLSKTKVVLAVYLAAHLSIERNALLVWKPLHSFKINLLGLLNASPRISSNKKDDN